MDLETTISGLMRKCNFCDKQILLIGPANHRKSFEFIDGNLVPHTFSRCSESSENYFPPQIRTCNRCKKVISITGFRRLDGSIGWQLSEIVDGMPSTIPHKCIWDSVDYVTGKQEKYHV